jgi:hypothetical protein
MGRELDSHADWVLLRYGDDEGNWIAIGREWNTCHLDRQ